jgi:prepilin-type N-terminal cleavage/methylation domain-containing protein
MSDKSFGVSRCGFTLIEVIVVLIVAGIFSAIVIPLFRSGVTTSSIPMSRLNSSMNLNAAISMIVSDYETNSCCNVKDSNSLTALKARIQDFSTNYGAYCSTCSATVTYPATVGSLTNAMIVTVTNSETNEKVTHVFTIQQ